MKKNSVVILAFIAASVLFVTTAIAKQQTSWGGYAYGTITDYDDAPSATIESGFWNLKVLGKIVWLNVYYMEENVIGDEEGAPDGSVDMFEISLLGKPMDMYRDSNDRLHIFAQVQIKKIKATDTGTYDKTTSKTWLDFVFDFDEEWVLIDGWPIDIRSDPWPGAPPEDIVVSGEPWTYDWDINGIISGTDYS